MKGFPQALAVFVALLGLVTVGHALASSPRRRRGELAVLRSLGFLRRQLMATLAVQATAVTAVGLVLGANLMPVLPARRAASVRPAEVLRAE